jgi:omega-6 fatty acid desaturase (delta-12 desaturase)
MPDSAATNPAEATTSADPLHQLRRTNLREVRATVKPGRLERSTARALFGLGVDFTGYLLCMAGVFVADALWLQALSGLGAGCFVAFLFVWAHDAAHGALFENRRLSEFLGTIAMLPSLNVYRLWAFGHNRVHHGFTSLSAIDWIWRPWTPQEYADASPRARWLYRIERSLPGCALHYLRRVWWDGMVRFNPGQTPEQRRSMRVGKGITLAFFIVISAIAWRYAGGWAGVLAGVLVPFIVFNYFIAFFVYLHHTHPHIPYFLDREQWGPAIGQVYCSTVIHFSRPMAWLTHNIMVHVPHHVHPHIPYYHLPAAYADIKARFGGYIHEYRFRWRDVAKIFNQCKLFDFEQRRWYRFDGCPAAA